MKINILWNHRQNVCLFKTIIEISKTFEVSNQQLQHFVVTTPHFLRGA